MKLGKRLAALMMALVLAVGVLAGCGKQDEVHLRVCLETIPKTLDPAMVTSDEARTVVSHLFENLMKLQSNGSGGAAVVSGMARSYHVEQNIDGTEIYTFTLRSSARWSDGQAVTAQDFVYAWRRLADPATGSANAVILDMVAGYSEARSGNPEALQVSAPDEHTFEVVLSGRCPYFLKSVCTAAATMPVRSDAAAQENWFMNKDTFLTNGPYRVKSWDGEVLETEQTEGYYGSRRLGPDGISFHFVSDAKTAASLFDRGDVDFVLGLTDETIAKKPDSWMPDYYAETSVVLLNQMSTLTSDENLRRAMSLVLDRNAVANLMGGRTILPAEGLVTWGIQNTRGEEFRSIGPALDNDEANYEKNCQTALELLAQSGYTAASLSALDTVTMLYESDGITDSLTQLLQKTWKDKLGLTVTLRGVSREQMTEALSRGEYTIAALRIKSDRDDATGFLNRWRSGNEGNYANFHSSAYDMLLRVAAVSDRTDARDAYLEDAERLLLETGNVIPLYYTTRSWELNTRYTGVFGDGLGRYFFTGVNGAAN